MYLTITQQPFLTAHLAALPILYISSATQEALVSSLPEPCYRSTVHASLCHMVFRKMAAGVMSKDTFSLLEHFL